MAPMRYWSPAVVAVSELTSHASVTGRKPFASVPSELVARQPVAVESKALSSEPSDPPHRVGTSARWTGAPECQARVAQHEPVAGPGPVALPGHHADPGGRARLGGELEGGRQPRVVPIHCPPS